jgi:hypothetical protein
MNRKGKIKLLTKAREEFQDLSRKTLYKARCFKVLDLLIKCFIAIIGALVAYASDDKNGIPMNYMKAFGIVITGLTAISSVFTFEKRAQSNAQVNSKCKTVIPELEEKITILEDASVENNEDIHDYLKNIFAELSRLSLASFTDSTYGKITGSQRDINN